MENIETLLAAVAAQTQGFDDEETINTEIRPESELSGAPIDDWGSMEVYPLPLAAVPAEIEKKRRGRPPRGQLPVKSPPLKKIKQDDEDEDVCFICFDGGSLVLCDRKGCPKAYHPACIKRDEAFFSTKAKWNCGWHICSVCRKNSHYMCYTCTYSLCKRCTKDEQYVRVRENKGFCATCMKTIMLIENKDQANSESVKVDFDDKLSWEYLFKVYWVLLKEKLSLTLSELTEAKNPWDPAILVSRRPRYVYRTVKDSISFRGSENLDLNNNKPHKDISFSLTDPSKEGTSNINNHVQPLTSVKAEDPEKPMIGGVNVNPSIVKAADEPVIVKTTDKPMIDKSVDKPAIEKDTENPSIVENINKPCICKHTDETKERDQEKTGTCNVSDWATKDLLEFVAHMKNGDKSHLSQFDVQTLLLDYIKRNNLRDPHQKSQIICDLRLTNLFGRARVGHIEMLKLLEYHFLVNEDSQKKSFIPAGLVGSPDSTADGNNHSSSAPIKGRKRKSRKKSEDKLPQNNLSEFAAIDFHNINLIYLRHKLMENLVEDKVNFNDKVIGSIVRIKISSSDQKPDVHRLVQVVGTSKVTQPYKVGDKTTDIMLEVLNLDKKETVSVDSISNLEFTEDECRRLRQSIRCGLMKQFTVGEIQNKAMALQSVRVNDWLEAEILRLNHLRDRASEKGRKKELREYVQKLQLLKSAEERQRRISEVPVIHADPKMSPNYESEEDAKSRENNINDQYPRPSYPGLSRGERKAVSPYKKGKQEAIPAQNQTAQKVDTNGSHRLKKHRKNQVPVNDQRARLETSIATASMGNPPSVNHIETEKLWHYRDPNGKIQGPFSMMQLRRWSTTGLFPPDMRIWTNHEQYDSLLLTHAMSGQFHGPSERPQNTSSDTPKQEANARGDGINVSGGNSKQTETAFNHVIDLSDRKSKQTEAASFNRGIDLSVRENKQSETASSNHAIDLSGRGSIQTKAVSANQAVDYCERDGKQTNAAPNHATRSSERNVKDIDMSSSNHAVDILEICKQINAASSSSQVDLSERDSTKTNRASSDHGLDLSEECKRTNAASFNNAIDFSDGDRTKVNAASSNHAIDLSDRDGTKANAASSNHAIDLSERDSTKANAASSNHSIDFSDRDGSKANASTSNHVIDSSQRDNKKTDRTSSNHTIDSSMRDGKQTEAASSNFAVDLSLRDESEQTKAASSNHAVDLSDGATGSVKADETNSPAWPHCWDLLTDSNPVTANVQASNVLLSSSLEQTCATPSVQDSESGENGSRGPTQNQTTNEHELQSDFIDHGPVLLTAEETLRSLSIDLMSESEPVTEPGQDAIKPSSDIHVADLNTPVPNTSNTQYEIDITETQQCISSDMTRMKTFLELLSPTPRSSEENQANDEKQSGLLDFSLPNSGTSWTNLVAGAQLPDDVGDEWCGYSPTPTKQTLNQEWDPGLVSLKPPTNENVATNNNNQLTLASPSYPTSWLAMLNEPIEFDALGEESVSDLLAEVDAMESQGGGGGGFPSPTSAMKFAKELLQDCKDDCFSSIEDFSSATHPVKSDAFSSTGEVHLTSHSSGPSNPTPIDFLDTFRRSGAHSSASSEGETNAPAFSSSEFHHPHQNNTSQDMVGPGTGSDSMDPGWGNVQGNINLVTVQGNVNLVLGPGQGMTNLGWGTNPGAPWANPNVGSLPWDGNQRKYEGERFTSPREWGYQGGGQAGFGRGGRPPWGRQGYGGGGGGGLGGGGGGGYSRPLPKGQRLCKFYESGRCKKGAFCDYLHP